MRKRIFLVILILIVAPGISKGATDVITGSEGEVLFGLQDSNYRFAATDNGLRLAASKTESVQSSQSMAITSAAVTFNPKKKDKFTVKGTTGSLSLTGAQSIIFAAGSFSQEITLDKFTQSKQKYTFKGATGAAGIASLVLDMVKGQFSATVQNLFLTGFTNPLPVCLKAGTSSECSMVQFGVNDNAGTETGFTNATAGIDARFNTKYTWRGSEPGWDDVESFFEWDTHYTKMTGKFTDTAFSGSWNYDDGGNFSGQMDITLDDAIGKATKIVSFSATDNFLGSDSSAAKAIAGGGGDLLLTKRETTKIGGQSYDTITFEVHGVATCDSVTSFSESESDFKHSEPLLSLAGAQCNANSKLIIQFALGDPCTSKIPLPKGSNSFGLDGVSFNHDEVPSVILGSNPEEISPIGFGKKTADGSPSSYEVKLCAFEKPVDIYLYFNLVWGDYFLDQNNKVRPKDKGEPWRVNVTGAINEVITGDFGGLFNGGRIPKGDGHMLVIVALPTGVNVNEATDAYVWTYMVSINCKDHIAMPTGREFFEINQSPPVPVTGSDPEQIIPFYVGDYALGGELLLMGVYFCPFYDKDTLDSHVDLHLGIYCPEDDPLNFYFANLKATEEKDLFQKVPMLRFAFSPKLPERAYSEKGAYDEYQMDQMNFFGGIGVAELLPKGNCQYIAAVTPVGVRDKFYAWVLPLDVNIKQAFIDLWKQVQKTGGSMKEIRKR